MAGNLKEKIEKLGVLLAQSPIAEEIKGVILENAILFTEGDVDALLVSFEREQAELGRLEKMIQENDVAMEKAVVDDEDRLNQVAREMIDKFLVETILKETMKKE